MSTRVGVLRRNSIWGEWLAFAAQVLIVVSFEVGDDLSRGFISQHGTAEGIANAHRLVAFEAAHGLWIEPAWQVFFEHTHRVFAFTITWPEVVRVMNGIYIFGHVFVTLGVALWVYIYRRHFFGLLRNTLILANLFALFLYESFPVAPPRMTTGLFFNHHSFTFQDTMYGMFTAGQKFVGTQSTGYNEFSAMPSVHMAWALLVGAALVFLARPLLVKLLGAVYPGLMLVAIVVTGNHYLLDAIGAALVLIVAAALAIGFECWRGRIPRRRVPQDAARAAS